jgi:hypothetical protein
LGATDEIVVGVGEERCTLHRAGPLGGLGDKLADAFDSNPERHSVDYERARYLHALRAMSDILRANNAPLHYAQRLNRLAVSLSDLNGGRVDAGAPTAQWLGRANVALGIFGRPACRRGPLILMRPDAGPRTRNETLLRGNDHLRAIIGDRRFFFEGDRRETMGEHKHQDFGRLCAGRKSQHANSHVIRQVGAPFQEIGFHKFRDASRPSHSN